VSPASYRCSLLVLALLAGAAFAGDLPDSSDEYRVKALFLFNFAKFVEWPNALPGDGISIGILGDDPFGDMLAQTIAGKTVNGHGFIACEKTRSRDGLVSGHDFTRLLKKSILGSAGLQASV